MTKMENTQDVAVSTRDKETNPWPSESLECVADETYHDTVDCQHCNAKFFFASHLAEHMKRLHPHDSVTSAEFVVIDMDTSEIIEVHGEQAMNGKAETNTKLPTATNHQKIRTPHTINEGVKPSKTCAKPHLDILSQSNIESYSIQFLNQRCEIMPPNFYPPVSVQINETVPSSWLLPKVLVDINSVSETLPKAVAKRAVQERQRKVSEANSTSPKPHKPSSRKHLRPNDSIASAEVVVIDVDTSEIIEVHDEQAMNGKADPNAKLPTATATDHQKGQTLQSIAESVKPSEKCAKPHLDISSQSNIESYSIQFLNLGCKKMPPNFNPKASVQVNEAVRSSWLLPKVLIDTKCEQNPAESSRKESRTGKTKKGFRSKPNNNKNPCT